MEANNFFLKIAQSAEDVSAKEFMNTIFEMIKMINSMSPEELGSLFQTLSMLKKKQKKFILRRNPILDSIDDFLLIIVQAMHKYSKYDSYFSVVLHNEKIRKELAYTIFIRSRYMLL